MQYHKGVINEALILASGLGTRLSDFIKSPKFALKLSKYPLIYYPILTLTSVGVTEFTIIIAEKYYDVARKLLDSLSDKIDISINLVLNKYPERDNGYSFLIASKHINSEYFYTSMSDHIYTRLIPMKLVGSLDKSIKYDVIAGVDSNPRYINLDEATKVATSNDKVIRFGKDLLEYQYVDIGVFITSSNLINYVSDLKDLKKLTFSQLLNTAIERGAHILYTDINGLPWTEIDTVDDLNQVLNGDRRTVLDVVLNEVRDLWR